MSKKSSRLAVHVYCPACGQTRTGGQYTHPANGNARVYSHKVTTAPGEQRTCPGGPITLGEDTAP